MLIKFRICRWLTKDEFEKIVKIATYTGRENGCSAFLVNAHNVSIMEKVLDIIDEFNAEVLGEFNREDIVKRLNELRVVEVYKYNNVYILRSPIYLNDYLQVFKEKRVLWYSRSQRGFLVKPYVIIDVLARLENEGFRIIDKTGLIMPPVRMNHLELGITLRPYQEEALSAWIKHQYRGVVALPTGSGKTVIGLGAITKLRVPSLIVVYTKEQLYEWLDKIKKFIKGAARLIGEFYSEKKIIKPITITTYQSAFRNINLLKDKFSLIIVDEAHHLPADKFRAIAEGILAPYRLGLSATPYREDGKHEELFSLIGGIVYSKTLADLISAGFIASFDIVPVLVPLEEKLLTRYKELRKRYFALARGREIRELVQAAALGDQSAKQALQVMSDIRKILLSSERKLDTIKNIVEKELRNNSKIIIFTQYISQAKKLGKKLGAPVVTSKTNKNTRNLVFNLFKSNRYRVLILTTLGDEGIDIPDANVGIIVSGTSSARQFIQRLGRLLRPAEGKTARLYYVALKDTQEERTMKKVLNKAREYLGLAI